MANTLLTIGGITRKALALFRNSNAFLQLIDRQYSSEFARSGAKIGSTVKIRLPNDYVVRTGPTAVPQNTVENQVTLPLTYQKGVDVEFTSVDLALSLDDFAMRILEPMVNVLAGQVATDIMTGVEGVPNFVQNYNSGMVSPVANTFLNAKSVLTQNSCPQINRSIILDPVTMQRTVSSLTGLYNPQSDISRQFKTGIIAQNVFGFDWAEDQTVIMHATGSFASGTVNGANQTGTAITVNAITGTLNVGDIITFAGVNQVNRVTKASLGSLQPFVVTAAVANGGTTINVYPALNPPVGGVSVAYQTVSASPANSAAIAPLAAASISYRKNFAFHPTACTMATADLDLPNGAVLRADRQAFDGISIRVVRDYLTQYDMWLSRLDILYGFVWPRPEWACIIADIV